MGVIFNKKAVLRRKLCLHLCVCAALGSKGAVQGQGQRGVTLGGHSTRGQGRVGPRHQSRECSGAGTVGEAEGLMKALPAHRH